MEKKEHYNNPDFASSHFKLTMVSTEDLLFSGDVLFVAATGQMGELGIAAGHTPLITALKPGQVRFTCVDGTQEVFYVSGGMLEIQPRIVTVLADAALRADALDEAAAKTAQQQARQALANQNADKDYSHTLALLAEATAKLHTIQQLRRIRKMSRHG